MERKLNIWILVGKGRGARCLEPFSELSERFELNAAVFLDDLKNSDLITNLNVRTYVEDPHLTGYLFGIEKDLAQADLLIVSDLNGEVAMQAADFCSQSRKPFIYYLQKSDLNVRSSHGLTVEDQKNSLLLASGYIVSDRETEESLEFIGIQKELIYFLSPGFYVDKYSYQQNLRDKFRNYVKISSESFLILCQGVRGFEKGALDLMKAVRILLNRHPEMQDKLKVLFTGDALDSTLLHHMAIDLNLVRTVLILAQKTEAFKRDIYSAADCVFEFEHDESVSGAVWDFFDAMSTGLDFVYNSDSEGLNYLRIDAEYAIGDIESIADKVIAVMQRNSFKDIRSIRLENLSIYSSNLSLDVRLEKLSSFLAEIQRKDISEVSCLNFQSSLAIADLKNKTFGLPYQEALMEIDYLLENRRITSDDKAKIVLLKGQLCLRFGLLESAMDCFEMSTSCDLTEREAYLGLGDVAVRSFSNDEALSFYRKALSIKPNDAEALAGLGNVYRRAGMPEEAVKWLGQSLLVDGDSSIVLKNLAQSSLEASDSEYVIEWLEKLRIYVGEQPALIMALGQLYYRVGENEKGGKLVSAALEFTTKSSRLNRS